MNMKKAIAAAMMGVLQAGLALAGGGPQNVLVVVNDQSIESQEVGRYYLQKRGIPERNLCRISTDPLACNLAWADFQTQVRDPIFAHIRDQGLTNQIDYIVLSKDCPTRINQIESSSGALFYGYKNAYGCSLPANTASFYAGAERAFRHSDAYGGARYYLVFHLSARHLKEAKALVDRGVAADGTAPDGAFHLLSPPGDAARNIRYRLFDNYDFNARFFSPPTHEILYRDYIKDKTNVLGYLTGRPSVPTETNLFLPGAAGDHLTSTGGYLPDGLGQGTVWQWIQRGASASYGTVSEPCAILQKFPDPMMYFWYARGFNLGESYVMSVRNPHQGLFVGDPLMAPYARPPGVRIVGLSSNQVVSGAITVEVAAVTNAAGIPPRRIELYVDDLFEACLTNLQPAAGNEIKVQIDAVTCSYTVNPGDTLFSAIEGIAYSVNSSNLDVAAYAQGDRLMLVYTNYGQSGAGIAYHASTEQGSASELTVFGSALSANLLESAYAAREYIAVSATTADNANAGDSVTCIVTLTNGVAATNRIVAAQGESPSSVMARMIAAINGHPALQGTDGVTANAFTYNPVRECALQARSPGPGGFPIRVEYRVQQAAPPTGLATNDSFTDNFNDGVYVWSGISILFQPVATARGNILFWCGRNPLTATHVWDTAKLPNGPCTLRAVAMEGSGVEAQGHSILSLVVSNRINVALP